MADTFLTLNQKVSHGGMNAQMNQGLTLQSQCRQKEFYLPFFPQCAVRSLLLVLACQEMSYGAQTQVPHVCQ